MFMVDFIVMLPILLIILIFLIHMSITQTKKLDTIIDALGRLNIID